MARDGDGAEPTTVFGLNDIFYCIVYVANGPDDTNVKAIWYGAETEGGEPTTQLDEVNTNQGSGSITFNLSNQEAWMPGAYRVEIYLNGVLDRTLDFEVQADVPPASGAVIEDAFMSRDEAGTQPTTLFGQNDVFYCIVTLANAPQDTNVRAAWTAVNVQGEAPNTFIDEADITQGDGVLTFNLSNNQAWPIGLYKVDLYLNSELVGTIEFEVQ
jgi:hypothetical protein